MLRTVVEIKTEIQAIKDAGTQAIKDAEIQAIKDANPNWVTDVGDKALITALTNQITALTNQITELMKEKNNISSTG